jgi:hypothetical protein
MPSMAASAIFLDARSMAASIFLDARLCSDSPVLDRQLLRLITLRRLQGYL